MNKILGGTVNTTDNQVTAQVKAEPTVARKLLVQLRLKANKKQTRRRTNTRRPAGEGLLVNKQLVKVKAQHVNAVQILVQMQWWSY